jgi:hypothetical protein
VPVFAGDFSASSADEDRLKTETVFKAMQAMGYQAATLGEMEFVHGYAFLKEQLKAHPGLFVSANVLDAATHRPLALPYVVRTYPVLHGRPAGKTTLRVAITGVLDPACLKGLPQKAQAEMSQVEVTDPIAAAKLLVPTLRKQADVVVVLSHASLEASTNLAKAVEGIDLLVVGHGYGVYIVEQNQKVNGATLVVNSDRSRFVAQASFTLDAQGPRIETRTIPLSNLYPDNTQMAALRDAYKSKIGALSGGQISEAEVTPVAALLPVYGGNTYVGSQACATCHAQANKVWALSAHSKAQRTLETTRGGINAKRPDCVRCHNVGFGQPSGYSIVLNQKDLAGVGCESCHGTGQQHMAKATQGIRPAARITRTIGGALLCSRCHDKENDPNFNYPVALEKIRHWGKGFKPPT